jgi:hypothetical protein
VSWAFSKGLIFMMKCTVRISALLIEEAQSLIFYLFQLGDLQKPLFDGFLGFPPPINIMVFSADNTRFASADFRNNSFELLLYFKQSSEQGFAVYVISANYINNDLWSINADKPCFQAILERDKNFQVLCKHVKADYPTIFLIRMSFNIEANQF